MIQNEFKMIFNAFRFRSRTLSMFSNALKMICNAFERFQNALKWKNGSTEFSLSLVFPNRVTFHVQIKLKVLAILILTALELRFLSCMVFSI